MNSAGADVNHPRASWLANLLQSDDDSHLCVQSGTGVTNNNRVDISSATCGWNAEIGTHIEARLEGA